MGERLLCADTLPHILPPWVAERRRYLKEHCMIQMMVRFPCCHKYGRGLTIIGPIQI